MLPLETARLLGSHPTRRRRHRQPSAVLVIHLARQQSHVCHCLRHHASRSVLPCLVPKRAVCLLQTFRSGRQPRPYQLQIGLSDFRGAVTVVDPLHYQLAWGCC